ncbi:MBL fold metallo-hydrolase [Porticoccaceae bacterium]|nr:MBL fold metallo-hydrolase [Porticoccaceae bacterium]MDC1452860.1 MBL fold metallo-hydrolase [Porticoccaceae bacterium]
MFKASQRHVTTPLISFFLMFLLVACDQTADAKIIDSAASQFTLDSNLEFAETLDIENQVDFDNAKRGLIASAPINRLNNARGTEIWNAASYDFVKGDAPDTVNPSLWRQAKLNSIRGLFEVEKGLYQLRGFDLANMSLIKSDNGWIVVDPLTTLETSRVAMDFAEQHLGPINITGVIFTHSHIDHFGGIMALLDAQQVVDNEIPVIAPVGFVHEAVSENVIAGPAMLRRGSYMYGDPLSNSPTGHVDTGLGKQVIFGSTSIMQPTVLVDQPQQSLWVDGVDIEFFNMPGSEAPSELTFYLPQWKAFCGAEVVSHVMHNVLTLRGAKVRDALVWSDYIGHIADFIEPIADAAVLFNSHHWPTWGHDAIVTQLHQQQDMYKFTHDQTVRLANIGLTPKEIAERLELPKSLAGNFHLRGYYGTLSHNSKAVYQYYFGWYNGNPATLNPLPPVESALRYVEFMGGAEALLEKAAVYQARGDYRWVAEVVNHLVFAEPTNRAARAMLAEAYRQMAYQAEAGPWRDIYLSGAHDLQGGAKIVRYDAAASKAFLQQVPLEQFMKALSVRLDGEKAEGEALSINIAFTNEQGEINSNFVMNIRNSVMHYRLAPQDKTADATLTLSKALFVDILVGEAGLIDLIGSDELSVDGSVLKLVKFFSLLGEPNDAFNIVLP